MFEELLRDPALHDLIPFVRMWYGVTSEFWWVDSRGKDYIIEQGDGGEQGDALMPALFCLALRPALQHIHARLPPGAEII
eukprot:9495525-Pyramimonas_sp.AAC.1